MKETFLVLLTAHLVGDFICQNNSMVKNKEKFWHLLLHVAIVTLSSFIIAAYIEKNFAVFLYFWVFLSHFVIDWFKGLTGKIKWLKKVYSNKDTCSFILDQTAHIVTLFIIAVLMSDIVEESLWLKLISKVWYLKGLVLISGLVACVFAGGILINKATRPFTVQFKNKNGLKNGGKWIGQLERALIFFFMLTGQTNTIGFLFTAKSILRFSEIKDPKHRKEAEYIIIGTFMSFGWALLIAYLTKQALGVW